MSKAGDPRRTARWRALRVWVLTHYPNVCVECGQTIDLTLPGHHPMGPTVDHVVSLGDGGAAFDPANLRPCHRTCNVRKENLRRNRERRTRRPRPYRTRTSRSW